MKYALAVVLAGALSLPLALAQDSAPQVAPPPPEPFVEAVPLCGGDGEVVGVVVFSNVPIAVTLTWDRKTCSAHAA